MPPMGRRGRRDSRAEARRSPSLPPSPPRRDEEWVRSVSTRERMVSLVWDGMMLDAATKEWRPAAGEEFPTLEMNEAIVFESTYLRGFKLPAHPFFQGLLYYYGLELCHLNPNFILHITIFIHLCEVYLGIAPHFNLFRYFFWVKPHKSTKKLNVVSGAGVQLKQKHSAEYISVLLISSNKGWHAEWFYTTNHAPQVPCNIDARPVPLKCWDEVLGGVEMGEVWELLALIQKRKAVGLTGVAVMANFAARRLQPLKEWVHLTYEYAGEDYDTMRHVPEPGKHDELVERIRQCFVPGTAITT